MHVTLVSRQRRQPPGGRPQAPRTAAHDPDHADGFGLDLVLHLLADLVDEHR